MAGINLLKVSYQDNVDIYSPHGSIINTETNLHYHENVAMDKKGRKVMVENSENDVIEYTYNENLDAEILRQNHKNGEKVETTYNGNGYLDSITKSTTNGKVTKSLKYDGIDDETISAEIVIVDNQTEIDTCFEYDNPFSKKLTSVTIDADTKLNFEYDPLARVTNKKLSFNNKVVLEDELEYLQYADNALDLVKEQDVKVNGELVDTTEYTYDVAGNIA